MVDNRDSIIKPTADEIDLTKSVRFDDDDDDVRRISDGEKCMAMLGCTSRRSFVQFTDNIDIPVREIVKTKSRKAMMARPLLSASDSRSYSDGLLSRKTVNQLLNNPFKEALLAHDDDDDEDDDDRTTTENNMDVLTEGQHYLSISFLVYIYSHLREMCRMGHTSVKMEDIDVHCPQLEQYEGRGALVALKEKSKKRYLESNTKSAGSIIRVMIAELEGGDECDDDEHGTESVRADHKEYHKSTISQFQTWIEESRAMYLDGEIEEVISDMKRKAARRRWRRAIFAVRFCCSLSGGGGRHPKKPTATATEADADVPQSDNANDSIDMVDLITEVKRDAPKYFHPGSVLHKIIETGVEIVWLSDLTPNDVVYGICVERELKKVTVVFRGTFTFHNMMINMKYNINEYRNPVKENYPGRADILRLHSGFSLYLMRKRKDTGRSKLQEICDKIDQIGREMAPDGDYKLSLTGHSLGGALATLCGFYIAAGSTEPGSCFARLSRVNIWTFASPRVGTLDFVHAWQHLERTGRIRHARFAATGDIVPLIPSCNWKWKSDDLHFFKHVGLRVQLHSVAKSWNWSILQQQNHLDNLEVTYPLRHDWASEIQRRFMSSHISLFPNITGIVQKHEPSEYQNRMRFAMAYQNALGHTRKIKTLDEYYDSLAKIPDESILEETSLQINSNVIKSIPRWFWLLMVVSHTMLVLGTISYLGATSDVAPMESNMLDIDAAQEGTTEASILVVAPNKLARKAKGHKNQP